MRKFFFFPSIFFCFYYNLLYLFLSFLFCSFFYFFLPAYLCCLLYRRHQGVVAQLEACAAYGIWFAAQEALIYQSFKPRGSNAVLLTLVR